jgi:hypothetical protein
MVGRIYIYKVIEKEFINLKKCYNLITLKLNKANNL